MTHTLTRRAFGGLFGLAAAPALAGIAGIAPTEPVALAPPLRPITPWQKIVFAVQAAHPAELVLFEMGQFWELYGYDAVRAAPLVNVLLTQRGCLPDGSPWQMCAVPNWLNPAGPVLSWLNPDSRPYLGPLQAAGFEVLMWRRAPGDGWQGYVARG